MLTRIVLIYLLPVVAGLSWPLLCSIATFASQQSKQNMYDPNDLISADRNEQKTALIRASYTGQIDIIEELLAKRTDPDARASSGHTSLILASQQGHVTVARLLIDSGADIDAQSQYGWTPLIASVVKNHHALVQLLLERGARVDTKPRYMRMPLLAIASMYGRTEIVKMLLQAGCDVDIKDDKGSTSLMHAANGDETSVTGGDLATVEVLLRNQANVNVENKRGWTPLMCAASNSDYDIDILKSLLAAGAKVNVKDVDGWTPLMLAAFEGSNQMVLELLRYNADVNAVSKEGKTALAYAIDNGHKHTSEILRNAGAR